MKRINFKRLVARNNRLILAYEKKYAKQIGRALQKQLRDYLETGILSDEITPILTDMYMKVGERLLIVPEGIEILLDSAGYALTGLLIVPEGIEIIISSPSLTPLSRLLIVPEGIEIKQLI